MWGFGVIELLRLFLVGVVSDWGIIKFFVEKFFLVGLIIMFVFLGGE